VGKKGAEKTGSVGAGIQRTNASASKERMLIELEKGREKVRNPKCHTSGELARFSQLLPILRRNTALFFYNF